ncbi:vitamin B12-dependent ribonucleotide reductase [candidate division WWE3 bacterium]|uniref:Vitamin B12-dependent ribonucleotide reductase n=1 Tax=candidate division WWE3 bacterium TaxID=2053526 RepID=A0A928TPL3_UNCKA|nr:vitamin B12-dependent ribonucleotide reductase [candidate division WWE3 bacterium]
MSSNAFSGVENKTQLAQDAKDQASKIWEYVTSVRSVKKRDGRTEDFHAEKLERSIHAAFEAGGMENVFMLRRVTANGIARLVKKFDGIHVPSTDDIREAVIMTLIDTNLSHIAKRYMAARVDARQMSTEPAYGKGVRVRRFYTKPGVHPYDEIEWETRDAVIQNAKGDIVFEQKNVEVPKHYSQTATNILVSKYFRGRLGTPERETSVRQMVRRVAKTISDFGRSGGYFLTEEDANVFEAELTSILVNQRAAFNSPVWFNVGVNPKPQCSACFINSVQDDMRSILNLAVTEGMLFKYGSGSGSNLSNLRSSKERLNNSSGKSSGPVSFMKGLDAFAGVIKSGGKTRRAAKMVILDADHPDIVEFTWCKAKEEKKAHALIDAGYDGSIDGDAYASIFFQNANNSVRATDEFMQAVVNNGEFYTKYVLGKDPCERFKARELMHQIAEAAWECGDPGMQYDTTINDWHTCANTDRIYASNPCSEYMFLNDTACNLASVNLMKFRTENGGFDVEAYTHACRIMITAQEIVVDYSSYPTPAIEQNSWDYRPLGLGYANLGALLMSMGIPYDSEKGRNLASALTSILSGSAYEQSAAIAEKLGPFRGYAKNESSMLRVMRKHRDAAYRIDEEGVPTNILSEARASWDRALAAGETYGYRNSQISVLAPTGTIGFLMDCQTTGIEPPIALVSYKWLVGGGMLKLVNETVPEALHALRYTEAEIRDILNYIDTNDTIEGAPHVKEEHLPVFDCAFKAARGKRSISPMGHIHMMAAVQPFISGAISKTVNLPAESTVEDVMNTYIEGWKLGLKAIAIYRDGCKRAQPLTTSKETSKHETKPETSITANANATIGPSSVGETFTPRRRRLPDERRAITHKFQIGPHEGYITVGLYEDGTPGEVFITMNKEGSTLSGLLDSFATAVSVGLQYGVPLKTLVNKFAHMRFEPSGFTPNPHIRMAKSIVDYIFRWLALKFLSSEERQALGLKVESASPILAEGDAEADIVKEFVKEDDRQGNLLSQNVMKDSVSGVQSLTATIDNQADAPACDTCGSIMIRNAACYKCLNCGSTSGCS